MRVYLCIYRYLARSRTCKCPLPKLSFRIDTLTQFPRGQYQSFSETRIFEECYLLLGARHNTKTKGQARRAAKWCKLGTRSTVQSCPFGPPQGSSWFEVEPGTPPSSIKSNHSPALRLATVDLDLCNLKSRSMVFGTSTALYDIVASTLDEFNVAMDYGISNVIPRDQGRVVARHPPPGLAGCSFRPETADRLPAARNGCQARSIVVPMTRSTTPS